MSLGESIRVPAILEKKRDGHALNKNEIDFLIKGYTAGEVPDYQMAAFAMAVFFRGMTDVEMTDLTRAMLYSGEVLDLSELDGPKVDKHSTGGVGDAAASRPSATIVLLKIIEAFSGSYRLSSNQNLVRCLRRRFLTDVDHNDGTAIIVNIFHMFTSNSFSPTRMVIAPSRESLDAFR